MLKFSFQDFLSLGNRDDGKKDAIVKRTRISARTVGFLDEGAKDGDVAWMGMTPVREGGTDQWRIVNIAETASHTAKHLPAHERLVTVQKVSEGTYSFEEAIKHLGVWELNCMRDKRKIAEGQDRADLGNRYFKRLGLRRGLAVAAYGKVAAVNDGIPLEVGKYLAQDIAEAEAASRINMCGTLLEELLPSSSITDVFEDQQGFSLEDEMTGYGSLQTLSMMQFYAEILVEYAKAKLSYIDSVMEETKKPGLGSLFGKSSGADIDTKTTFYDHLRDNKFFDKTLIERFTKLRGELAESIYKAFHFANQDEWNQPLDLKDREFLAHLRSNPDYADALATAEFMTKPIKWPISEEDEQSLIFISARALVYLKEMFRQTPQAPFLARMGKFNENSVMDLLNFLDLVEAKFLYTEVAKQSFKLPNSLGYKALDSKKDDLNNRLAVIQANYEAAGGYGDKEQQAVEEFLRARYKASLPARIENLAKEIGVAREALVSRTFSGGTIAPKPKA